MEYKIRILAEQIGEAIVWCNEQFGNRWNWQRDSNIFYFEHEADAMAFKLRFDESTRVLLIDPPSGWKYGFPRPFDKKDDQTLGEWLVENGYPQSLIDQGMTRHCRYWETDV